LHLTTDERVGDRSDAHDGASVEHDRVLELAVSHFAAGRDRREGADVAVDDPRVLADDDRAAYPRPDDLGAPFDDDPPLDLRPIVDRALDALGDRLQDAAIALEQRVLLAGVEPPAFQD